MNILDFYYAYKECIFWGVSILMAVGCLTCFILKVRKEGVKYIADYSVHLILSVAFICFVGEILYQLGYYPRMSWKYFNWSLFFIPLAGIIVYGLIQAAIFRKILLPICMTCKYLWYLLVIELFWLAFTGYLEFPEFIAGTAAVCFVSFLMIILEKAEYSGNVENLKKETGYPNTDLYPTRRKQLNSFISVLDEQKDEPYAIMISGEWGTGKTSFVKALEEKKSEDIFIWIQAGSEKTAADIMQDIANQIITILKKEGTFLEEDKLIDQYFLAFAHTIANAGEKTAENVLNVIHGKNRRDSKEYINRKLKELKKTIYLVVDDLDRCDCEYQQKMFRVIRESTDLRHCKPLFLVDKKLFLNGEADLNYIEKYVSYTLDLCTAEFYEISGYEFPNIFFDDSVFAGLSNILLRYSTPEKLKRRIRYFPEETLKICEKEVEQWEEKSRKINSVQVEERTGIQNLIENDRRIIQKIKQNITSPRKVKNYLKSVKRGILQLNQGIDMCAGEYREADWLEALIAVKFTEHFLPEEYWKIKASGSVTRWQKQEPDHLANTILDIGNYYTVYGEKKRYLVEQLVFRLEAINFEVMHTEEEGYLFELRSGRGNIDSISKYIEYSQEYDDLKKILDVVSKESFSNDNRMEFLEDILTCLSGEYSRFSPKDRTFYDFSRELTDFLCEAGLSDKEKATCIYYGHHIAGRAIIENAYVFRNILLLLCDKEKVEKYWQSLSVINIDEFYAALQKIDEERFYQKWTENDNKLECIRVYYNELKQDLTDDKYESIADIFIPLFERINIVLDICSLWDGLERILEDRESDTESAVEKYFIIDRAYTYKEDIFAQITVFVQALRQLKIFYEQQSKETYNSNMSLILLRVLCEAGKKLSADPEWFGDYYKEICSLFEEMAEKVYSLDEQKNDQDKNIIQQILIYAYRFKI